jgi:hypothetical protein
LDELGVKKLSENREYIVNLKTQNLILQVITQALLGEEDKTIYYWQQFVSSVGSIEKQDTQNIYYAMAIFSRLEPLNSISIYKKPYYFKKMYESIINLFVVLNNKRNIENEIKQFQKSLLHNRIKNIYASMEFYPNSKVDFSLLLSEHFRHNHLAREYMNEVLPGASENKKDLSMTINNINQILFGEQNYELSYALLSMRYGQREKDLNLLLEELDYD